MKGRELKTGIAAEHLVCSDLIMSGYDAHMAGAGASYDVVLDTGSKLIRVQVKSTLRPRPIPQRKKNWNESYCFQIRRAGKGSSRIVGNDEFDLLALVAMDIRQVAYMPIGAKVLQTIHLRTPHHPSMHGNKSRGCINGYPLKAALVELSS